MRGRTIIEHRTRVAVSLKPLSRHLLLKRRRATLATETVRLPADHLRHGRPSRNEDPADRILYHLILASGESTFGLPASEFPKGAAEQKIQDDEKNKDEDNSIHSGINRGAPQSYGTLESLSTLIPASGADTNQPIRGAWHRSNGLLPTHLAGLNPVFTRTSDG